MDLFFLSAGKPITKHYSLNTDGTLNKQSYPFVYNVTSTHITVKNLTDMHLALVHRARLGDTLIKGTLSRALTNESRAGTTNSDDPTGWICLDLDGIENFQSVDMFLDTIGCADVDYILQWSSSMNVESNTGFRCHIFMLLAKPTHPQLLKHWLQQVNLNTPALRAQLSLTKTGNSLSWPLDITTCQNDKLLYIAPPLFAPPLKDPFPGTQRISLVTKNHRSLILPNNIANREVLHAQTLARVNELRVQAQLPKRRATKLKYSGLTEYMPNPDSATVTGTKTERGFVYLNLNGGDSWAYYHPEDNYTFIHNFKGEPAYRTEELLPLYYAQLTSTLSTPNRTYLAFRDFASACYYNGTYDPATDDLNLAMAKNEGQLKQFLKQHGQPIGAFIPDWTMTFDPKDPVVIDTANRILNTYRPSEYFKNPLPPSAPSIPPVIGKIMLHVLGDAATVDHFSNWLAVIAQTLDRTGTAWVLHGTQGTGKGLLFHQILAPLFGEWNTSAKRMEEIESDFTGFMKNSFLLFVDEVQAGKSLYHSKVTAKLKNLIVEPYVSIREMYKPAYMYRNRINMIFASNKNDPVEVDPDDRRFNVALRQEEPLKITSAEIDRIPSELPHFLNYLQQYPMDTARARTPLVNDSRNTMIATNRLSVDVLADNILNGDLEALWDYLPARKPVGMELGVRQALYERYRALMIDIISAPNTNDKLSREDLATIFNWCVGGMPESPNKFTSLLRHHRIHMNAVWKDNRTVRGIAVKWTVDPTWHANAQQEIANNAV